MSSKNKPVKGKPAKKKAGKMPGKKSGASKGFIVALAALIVLGLTAGVGAALLKGGGGDGEVKLPDYAFGATAPKGAAKAYQFAVDRPDLLAQIPCYCGCGSLDGHDSNLDCFIKSIDGGEVTFDDHASY